MKYEVRVVNGENWDKYAETDHDEYAWEIASFLRDKGKQVRVDGITIQVQVGKYLLLPENPHLFLGKH